MLSPRASAQERQVVSKQRVADHGEVLTGRREVNAMLDLVKPETERIDSRFLEPACGTGNFLAEILERKLRVVEARYGRSQLEYERYAILTVSSVYGIDILEDNVRQCRQRLFGIFDLNYLRLFTGKSHDDCRESVRYILERNIIHGDALSLKTVGDNPKPIVFSEGNILFRRVEHTWANGRCGYCGANEEGYARGAELESHAYAFIHADKPKELFNMKFDVIVGNPPYQLSDGGHGESARPIYQLFVEQAKKLNPRYLSMIIPSRWFAGGKGLDGFRDAMLHDHRLSHLVDYPKLYDGFPGVKIRGGVSYFLWDRDYNGPCSVQTMWDGEPLGAPMKRRLDAYDVLVRRNEAVSILDKVRAYSVGGKAESTLDGRVSTGKPFGLRTFFHGAASSKGLKHPVKLHGSQRISWVARSAIDHNADWIDGWKVLMNAVQGTSAAVETKFLSNPIIAGPGEACTETYLVAGRFDTEKTAKCYAAYLRTRFVRFLVSLRKATQHANRGVYAFVPDIPLNRTWTDGKLYERYGLTPEEIAFIESTVKPMDAADE